MPSYLNRIHKIHAIILILFFSGCVKNSMSSTEIRNQFNGKPEVVDNAISPNGSFHLFVLSDGAVLLKNLEDKTEKFLSPACSDWGGEPITWDRNDELSCVDKYKFSRNGCGSGNWCRAAEIRAAFSPDGKYAITTSTYNSGVTIFWKTEDWSSFFITDGAGNQGGFFKISSDGKFVAIVDYSPKFGESLSIIDLEEMSEKLIIGMHWKEKKDSDERYTIEYGLWHEALVENLDSDINKLYERFWPTYNFDFSDDNRFLIIEINDKKHLLYNIKKDSIELIKAE